MWVIVSKEFIIKLYESGNGSLLGILKQDYEFYKKLNERNKK